MTAEQLAARMRQRAAAVEPAFRKTTKSVAAEAVRFCRLKLTELIYAKPIPTREQVNAERRHATALKSGRLKAGTPFSFTPSARRGSKGAQPAWRRTGALRRGEEPRIVSAYAAKIINTMDYAEPRHEAGKPDRRKTRYPAHWRDELLKAFRPRLREAYRQTVQDILRKGGLD